MKRSKIRNRFFVSVLLLAVLFTSLKFSNFVYATTDSILKKLNTSKNVISNTFETKSSDSKVILTTDFFDIYKNGDVTNGQMKHINDPTLGAGVQINANNGQLYEDSSRIMAGVAVTRNRINFDRGFKISGTAVLSLCPDGVSFGLMSERNQNGTHYPGSGWAYGGLGITNGIYPATNFIGIEIDKHANRNDIWISDDNDVGNGYSERGAHVTAVNTYLGSKPHPTYEGGQNFIVLGYDRENNTTIQNTRNWAYSLEYIKSSDSVKLTANGYTYTYNNVKRQYPNGAYFAIGSAINPDKFYVSANEKPVHTFYIESFEYTDIQVEDSYVNTYADLNFNNINQIIARGSTISHLNQNYVSGENIVEVYKVKNVGGATIKYSTKVNNLYFDLNGNKEDIPYEIYYGSNANGIDAKKLESNSSININSNYTYLFYKYKVPSKQNNTNGKIVLNTNYSFESYTNVIKTKNRTSESRNVSNYNQDIVLKGIGTSKNNYSRVILKILRVTDSEGNYAMQYRIRATSPFESLDSAEWHDYYKTKNYYEIYLIPKNITKIPIGKAIESGNIASIGTLLYSAKGNEKPFQYSSNLSTSKFDSLEKHVFDDGDMLYIKSPERKYTFNGNNVKDPERGREINYNQPNDNGDGINSSYKKIDPTEDDKGKNTVYMFTSTGLIEIYNEKPKIVNYENPILLQYSNTSNDVSQLIKTVIKANDDRDSNGNYVKGGFDITNKLGIIGSPKLPTNRGEVGGYNMQYNVTDSWERDADMVGGKMVILPNLSKHDINGLSFNKGIASYPENTIVNVVENRTSTIQLPNSGSKIFTNKNEKEIKLEITYDNNKKFVVSVNDDISLPDGGKLTKDQYNSTNINGKEVQININGKDPIYIHSNGAVEYNMHLESKAYIDKDKEIPTKYDNSGFGYYLIAGSNFKLSSKIKSDFNTGGLTNYKFKGIDLSLIASLNRKEIISNITKVYFIDGNEKELILDSNISINEFIKKEYNINVINNSKDNYLYVEGIINSNFKLDINDYNGILPMMVYSNKFINSTLTNVTPKYRLEWDSNINMTLASNPILDNVIKKYDTSISNNILENDFAKKYLSNARAYDETTSYSIFNLTNKPLERLSETYKRYDFETNQWIDSSKNNFENLTDLTNGTGIYKYNYIVKDIRRDNNNIIEPVLSSESSNYLVVGKNVEESEDNKNFIITNGSDVSLKETEISYLGSENKLIEKIISNADAKGVSIDPETGKITEKNLKIDIDNLNINNPIPGEYNVKLYFGEGASYVSKTINLIVKENTWDYDTDNRTEVNGASGYIVIPKCITLEKVENKKELSKKIEVYFANYSSATGVKYNLSVDKTFEMINKKDPSNKFNVKSSFNGAQVNGNKLIIGEINNTNTKNNGKFITFSASSEVPDKTKGRWEGMVTFYFERK